MHLPAPRLGMRPGPGHEHTPGEFLPRLEPFLRRPVVGARWLRSSAGTPASATAPTCSIVVCESSRCSANSCWRAERGSGNSTSPHPQAIHLCTRRSAPRTRRTRFCDGDVSPEKTTDPSSVLKREARAGKTGAWLTIVAVTRTPCRPRRHGPGPSPDAGCRSERRSDVRAAARHALSPVIQAPACPHRTRSLTAAPLAATGIGHISAMSGTGYPDGQSPVRRPGSAPGAGSRGFPARSI